MLNPETGLKLSDFPLNLLLECKLQYLHTIIVKYIFVTQNKKTIMKKFYILIVAGCLSGAAFAQSSLTAITPVAGAPDMVTAPNMLMDGDTAEFTTLGVINTIQGRLSIINTTGASKTVKVRRTVLSAVPGSSNLFCWDLCYSPSTSLSSGSVTIAPGDTTMLFYGDYEPNGFAGTSYIRYKFFNQADTTDAVSITIKFTAGSLSIEDEPVVLANVYPNPASQFINFDYTIGNNNASISIADMTGKIVKNINLPENSTKQVISLDGFMDGIYIYTFYADNKAIATKKFIVRK